MSDAYAPMSAMHSKPRASESFWPLMGCYALYFLGFVVSLVAAIGVGRGMVRPDAATEFAPGMVGTILGILLGASGVLMSVAWYPGSLFGRTDSVVVFIFTPLPAAFFSLFCWFGSLVRKTEHSLLRGGLLTGGVAALAYVALLFSKRWTIQAFEASPFSFIFWPHIVQAGLILAILSQWPVDEVQPAAAVEPQSSPDLA